MGVEVVVEVVVGGCMMMMPPHIPHTPPNTSPPPPFITGHIEGVKFSGGAGNQWKGSIWRGSKVSHSVWFCFIASQHC